MIEENKDYLEVKRWRYASKRKIKLIMLYLNRFVLQGNYLNRLDYKEIEEKIRWNFKFNKEFIIDILRSYKNENAINFIMKADSIEDLFITGSNSLLAVIEKELTALQSTTLSGEAYREMESLMPFNGKEFEEKPLNEGKDNKRYYHIIAPGFIRKKVFGKRDEDYNLSANIRDMNFADLHIPDSSIAKQQFSNIRLMPFYFANIEAGKRFTKIAAPLQTPAQKEDNKKKYKALQPLITIETLDRLLWLVALYYYQRKRKDDALHFLPGATLKEIQNSPVILSFSHNYIDKHIPLVLLKEIFAKMPDIPGKAVINRNNKAALEIQFSNIQLQVPPYLLNTNCISYKRENLCAAMLQSNNINIGSVVDYKTLVMYIDEAMSRNNNTSFTATDLRQLVLYTEKEVLQVHEQEAKQIVTAKSHVGFNEVCNMIKADWVPKKVSEFEVELLRYLRNCAMHYNLPVYYNFEDGEDILSKLGITKRRLDAEGMRQKADAKKRKRNREGNNIKYPTRQQRNRY